MLPLDLRPYKSTGFITFTVKSNMCGSIGLSIYNHENYNSIIYSVNISQTDTWSTITMPIYHKDNCVLSSPHVSNAIAYIKQHYSEKIKLEEIGQYVHLHPQTHAL